MAGLRAARARGKSPGRPRKLAGKDVEMVRALVAAGVPLEEIAGRFSIHRSSIYRYLPKAPSVSPSHP